MVVALRQPDNIANVIAVDNAPVDAALKSDFAKYVQGMKAVEQAKPRRQSEADEIMKPYAEVRNHCKTTRMLTLPYRSFQFANSF